MAPDLIESARTRLQLLAALPGALKSSRASAASKGRGQVNLLDLLGPEDSRPEALLPDVGPVTLAHVVAMLEDERQALGYYQSGHPLQLIDEWMLARDTLTAVSAMPDGAAAEAGGMVRGLETRTLKPKPGRKGSGGRMAKFRLEDMRQSVGCLMWPDAFACFEGVLADHSIAIVSGKVSRRGVEPEIVVSGVEIIEWRGDDG